MTKHTIFPKGYRLTVTTWENDADNYNTKTIEGLTFLETKFYVGFCKLFGSSCNNEGIGNMYDPNDAEIEKFKTVVKGHIEDNFEIAPEDFKNKDFDAIHDFMYAFCFSSVFCWYCCTSGASCCTRVISTIPTLSSPPQPASISMAKTIAAAATARFHTLS